MGTLKYEKKGVSEKRKGKEREEGRGRERNREELIKMTLLSQVYNLRMFLFMLDYETHEALYNSIYPGQKIPQTTSTLKQGCTYVPSIQILILNNEN